MVDQFMGQCVVDAKERSDPDNPFGDEAARLVCFCQAQFQLAIAIAIKLSLALLSLLNHPATHPPVHPVKVSKQLFTAKLT